MSVENFKYDLFDSLNTAIMLKEPIVVVEGKDDRQIYQRICNTNKLNIKVRQISEFLNYSAGCEHVIDAIDALQQKFIERTINSKFILGIIDKDVRCYRNLINPVNRYPVNLTGLFITKYYSIENYFATKKNLKKLISKITHTVVDDIKSDAINYVLEDFNNNLEDLFLISLEALKNACETDYDSIIGYDVDGPRVVETNSRNYLISQLTPKQAELFSFADSLDINISDIKHISKGKWYLYSFVYYCFQRIKNLKDKCRLGEINQCQSCKTGNTQDCLYKLKMNNYNYYDLYYDILEFIDENECIDIINRLKTLYN